MPTKSLRRNPGWKLEEKTISLIQEARSELGLTGNADVVAMWAKQWKEGVFGHMTVSSAFVEAGKDTVVPPNRVVASEKPIRTIEEAREVMSSLTGEKPMAVRVETPYQIERRMRLEAMRAQLEGSNSPALPVSGALGEVSGVSGTEALVLPFEVVVNGEKHRVREFHGRRVLEWIGPKVNVMKKNLTPQETVIYWRQRIQ